MKNNKEEEMKLKILFGKGYKYIKKHYNQCEELQNCEKAIESYRKSLKSLGLKDCHIRPSNFTTKTAIF